MCSISLVACHRGSHGCSAIVSSWVQNIFSWVPIFLSWVFRGSPFFLLGNYFVGPRFSLEGNFVILSSWWNEKKWHRNISETTYIIPNRFQELWILLILRRYLLHLLNYLCYYVALVYTSCIFSHLFLGNTRNYTDTISSLVPEIYSYSNVFFLFIYLLYLTLVTK